MTTKLPSPPLDCISRVRFAPSGSNHLLASSWDCHVRLYDVTTGQLAGMHKRSFAVLDCAFWQDPGLVLSAGLDGSLVSFDFHSQQEMQLGTHDEAIRCIELHPMTGQVLTGSWDRSLRSWDPRKPGAPIAVVPLGAKVFSMDVGSERVIVGGSDRRVHIFDIRRLGPPLERRESSLRNQIRALKVGADQRTFASSSVEGRVAIEYFDEAENQQSRYAFKCHRVKDEQGVETVHPVNAIAFHPKYGTFATGGSDGGVCVWDIYAKKRLWRLSPFDTAVSSLAFSSDGGQLAIGVSYTFDDGERDPPPLTELVIRKIDDAEVMPKPRT